VIDCPYWFTALDIERIERARREHGAPHKIVKGRDTVISANLYASDADARVAALAILRVVADVLTSYRDHPQLLAAARSLRDQLVVHLDSFRPKDEWPTLEAFATAVEQALAEQPWWARS
jgi:hypothetical protein